MVTAPLSVESNEVQAAFTVDFKQVVCDVIHKLVVPLVTGLAQHPFRQFVYHFGVGANLFRLEEKVFQKHPEACAGGAELTTAAIKFVCDN